MSMPELWVPGQAKPSRSRMRRNATGSDRMEYSAGLAMAAIDPMDVRRAIFAGEMLSLIHI